MERKKLQVFLNKPIDKLSNDWIGVESYVNVLKNSIECGANVIAITSKFGGGKSSLIELLQKEIKDEKYLGIRKYKFVKINLWSHLNNVSMNDPLKLHKEFVYQLASQMNKNNYISNRMNRNFGFFKIEFKDKSAYILVAITALTALVSYFITKYLNYFLKLWPENGNSVYTVLFFSMILALFFGFILLSKSGILFSSSNSETNRLLEENEIIDLYKMILKKRIFKGQHYVIVFEDLDRSEDCEMIIKFLKEINKYYFYSTNLKTKTTFIVGIKSEGDLKVENDKIDYNKVFDFIIDLPSINIDSYDAILKGLLSELENSKYEYIDNIKEESSTLFEAPGMQWIIRGKNLDIRKIKNRLNMALIRYDFLMQKVKNHENIKINNDLDKIIDLQKPSFEQCAAAAYIMTEHSEEFSKIEDNEFEQLVSNSIIGENLENELQNYDERFANDFKELLSNHIIDTNYRMYYYNFPKNSPIYSVSENTVVNALLYGEKVENLEKHISKLENDNIINSTLKRLLKLKLNFPDIVFKNSTLFDCSVNINREYTITSLANLMSKKEFTSDEIVNILNFKSIHENATLRNDVCDKLIEILHNDENWVFREKILLYNDILNYSKLFYKPAPLLTINEMNILKNASLISKLIDYDNKAFTSEMFDLFHYYVLEKKNFNINRDDMILRIYEHINERNDIKDIIEKYIGFMRKFKIIVDFMENKLLKKLDLYKNEYINLLNDITDEFNFSENTFEKISKYSILSGLNEKVCRKLYNNGYYFEYITNMSLINAKQIDFKLECIKNTVIKNHSKLIKFEKFHLIRKEIIKQNYNDYSLLFDDTSPALTDEELKDVSLKKALVLINPKTITLSNYRTFSNYFSSSYRNPKETFNILDLIAEINEVDVLKKLFYSLDNNKMSFNRMATINKRKMLKLLNKCLNLNTCENVFEFMRFTKCLFVELEKTIQVYVSSNTYEKNCKIYDETIMECGKLTEQTVINIRESTFFRIYDENIEKQFYEKKLFKEYLVSKILREKIFDFNKDANLLDEYVPIINTKGFDRVRPIMIQNNQFVAWLCTKCMLADISDECYMDFKNLLQNSALLKRGFDIDNSSDLIDYFSSILGFADYDSAKYFVKMVTNGNYLVLLQNETVYNNIHEKLINPALKRKYTIEKNKNS